MRIKMVHRDTMSCEPIVRQAPNGELLLVCQCGDVKEPAPDNRVYVWHSNDDGETWSKPVSIYPETGQAVYQTEVMVYKGLVSVFLTLHSGQFSDWKCTVMQSTDSGYTWEDVGPIPCLTDFAFIRGMVELSDGTVILPYHHYPVTDEESTRLISEKLYVWNAKIPYIESGVLISKDGGKTFERSVAFKEAIDESIPVTNYKRWNWPENTIVELSDGSLAMLFRKNFTGTLWESRSYDKGITWTNPKKNDIPNPSNKPKLLKFRDGRIALLNTPNSNTAFSDRHPLEIWISNDDMKTWGTKIKFTDFPGVFSYPDGFITDDQNHIKFVFDFNRSDIYFVDCDLKTKN